ncbi:hypothetical protein DFR72_111256 [Lentzea flaviverrucosa]|uniref:Uncharacterized protein n=1 Tax=Lentzea flaviverrucosa TaxID=200379 RepID=A0A1H9WUQ1_9PSEU|nr:hypothetical protein DFR72_111256 [Lentzea flaviverrucosa]SES37662.1 hypothetical protein SAMN05216195_112250 [Lentzea flaviverrucosa]
MSQEESQRSPKRRKYSRTAGTQLPFAAMYRHAAAVPALVVAPPVDEMKSILLAEGLGNHDIAARLLVALTTVRHMSPRS